MVEDEELEKLREQKREQLRSQEQDIQEEQLEKKKQGVWNQAKQYMTEKAKERLSNIKTVDEEKALSIAQQINMLGDSQQIQKINEQQMKQILKGLNQEQENNRNIKFRR